MRLRPFASLFIKSTFVLCITISSALADDVFVKVERILSVYDGDTFRAELDGVDWPDPQGAPIRVAGVDTPEIKGRCEYEKRLAVDARDAARALLKDAEQIELSNLRQGYYGRIVADVWIDGVNLADELIHKGLGRRYVWGKRRGWCP